MTPADGNGPVREPPDADALVTWLRENLRPDADMVAFDIKVDAIFTLEAMALAAFGGGTHVFVPIEPTEAMVDRGYCAIGETHYEPTASAKGWGEHAVDVYRAMIEAAINEKKKDNAP